MSPAKLILGPQAAADSIRLDRGKIRVKDRAADVDLGNVFHRISDVSITDLRESRGIGLRVRTPWLLIRGDDGLALDCPPGEPRSRFYFSIGQAF